MRILIIDDDHDNRNLLASILDPYGDCQMAGDGLEGIKAYQKSIDEKNRFDFITMDMMMPEMNGHETLQKIREMEQTQGIDMEHAVKVVIVSANNDYETIMQSLSQSSAYIEKPINKNNLIAAMESLNLF